ncbi:MAG: YedE-related selenium metabolism membrane protein, partial [Firmicutes bacterium HGW-Firmicutes-13]
MKNIFFSRAGIIIVGAIIGTGAALLQYFGNPPNMGICVACFIRDTAGALGLHRADVVQYLRPEIMGFVLGGFITAYFFKEFRSRGGSSPMIRFCLGFFCMVGALVFLGCPVRMLIRLAGGDLNGIPALLGI